MRSALLVLPLLSSVFLSPIEAQNGWRMAGYKGSRTNNSPATGPASTPTFQTLIANAPRNLLRIAKDGSLILFDGNNLSSFSKTGTSKWTIAVGGVSDIAIGPTGTVYTSTPGSVSAWNANTGQAVWSGPYIVPNSGNETSALAIDSQGTIYIVTGSSYVGPDQKVTAINPNGTLKWQQGITFRGYEQFVLSTDETTGYILDLTNTFTGPTSLELGVSTNTGEAVYSTQFVVRSNTYAFATWNTLYTGGLDGLTACTPTLSCGGISSVADGVATLIPPGIIVSYGFNGRLIAFDKTGQQLWAANEPLGSAISDSAGRMYAIAPQTNDLVAFNGSTGVELWRQHFSSSPSSLLLGDDGSLYINVGTDLLKSSPAATIKLICRPLDPGPGLQQYAPLIGRHCYILATTSDGKNATYGAYDGKSNNLTPAKNDPADLLNDEPYTPGGCTSGVLGSDCISIPVLRSQSFDTVIQELEQAVQAGDQGKYDNVSNNSNLWVQHRIDSIPLAVALPLNVITSSGDLCRLFPSIINNLAAAGVSNPLSVLLPFYGAVKCLLP